ncbi:type IV secretory system conjugative DNA transfer family protein [Mycolicibacterium mageritense]|uniref:type IV secretory system conjugative DNA transfer family protein n=1 Tax=Mycolicibacterium mageritense TaxID=53462 RepID=UPI001E42E1D1|nr:TraM recognition domain-containing protein [Mycolicibacterium mageritense]MCC9184364.1 TraM recognition domain-containing protein [Mycolicibacterium mageritense]
MSDRFTADGYRPPPGPFAGWVYDKTLDRLVVCAHESPHVLGLAPPGSGKSRKWLAQSATLWPPSAPALVSSSKDDVMQMVASRRWGRAQLLDLRPIDAPPYPQDFERVCYDPTMLITTFAEAQAVAEALLSMASVGFGGAQARNGGDTAVWKNLAFAPLTCLLYAASPRVFGQGMRWVIEAAEEVSMPQNWPTTGQIGFDPSWVTAAVACGDRLFETRTRGVLEMVDKQRDSVKITVTDALTAWLRTAAFDANLPPFDPTFLDDGSTTLYVLSPADGAVAPQVTTLIDQLISRQRVKVAQWEEYPRLGMFLDELPNTPLPKILQYFAESRGLGVSICAAAHSTSQLDVIYGPLQGKAIRDVVPATLLMYGTHEPELMAAAAFWGGKTTRSQQSYNHNSDDKTTSRQFGNAFEPEELSPRNPNQARLLVRGQPGTEVELMDWTEFVKYYDELVALRRRQLADAEAKV